ncbi:30S ribosomal protein S6 [Calditerrivibrio nitroreducens]|uniref:Small ribosomal subunit protein bS6 n=1 Tax=Calditerrivibrio nitroreducens (strain DSM 19672 / NBRC 101217 / Yu37-1) TaxID=768670 RepID=E4TF89_CALNY|nr:30S ribosomal protein S6 [Calditerrivibrio nitroreducens]ADR18428.1 ribosomal protein S6 [Calditerrivibrio nitroreducens DSM 19672]
MNTYETVFIVSPALPLDDANAIFEKFKDLISTNGGEILNSEYWGKLKMAYPINKHKEGCYYLIQYKADGKFNSELETRFKYDENVLRFVVVKLDGKNYKLRKRDEMTKPRSRRYEEKPQTEVNVDETVVEQNAEVEENSTQEKA